MTIGMRYPRSLLLVLAGLLFLGCWVVVRGCAGDDPPSSGDHWIWLLVDPPAEPGDAFPFLHLAVQMAAQNQSNPSGTNDERLVRALAQATNYTQSSGRPNRLRLRPTNEIFSDQLVGTDGEILYEHLPAFTKQVVCIADRALIAGRTPEALAIAKDMILVAFLAAKNGEDKVLATWRLATWEEALRVMKSTALADQDEQLIEDLKRAKAELDAEWIEVRERDSNRLYRPFG